MIQLFYIVFGWFIGKKLAVRIWGDRRNQVQCPFCFKMIDKRATVCAYCQRDLPANEAPAAIPDNRWDYVAQQTAKRKAAAKERNRRDKEQLAALGHALLAPWHIGRTLLFGGGLFIVRGVDRETGKQRELTLNLSTPQQARRLAAVRGVVAGKVSRERGGGLWGWLVNLPPEGRAVAGVAALLVVGLAVAIPVVLASVATPSPPMPATPPSYESLTPKQFGAAYNHPKTTPAPAISPDPPTATPSTPAPPSMWTVKQIKDQWGSDRGWRWNGDNATNPMFRGFRLTLTTSGYFVDQVSIIAALPDFLSRGDKIARLVAVSAVISKLTEWDSTDAAKWVRQAIDADGATTHHGGHVVSLGIARASGGRAVVVAMR